DAIEPVKDYLRRADTGSSWAIRIFSGILPEAEVISIVVDYLKEIGPQYMRNPEKKLVLLQFLEGKDDPRIAATVAPMLEDMVDDVKVQVLKILAPLKYEPAREAILHLATAEE